MGAKLRLFGVVLLFALVGSGKVFADMQVVDVPLPEPVYYNAKPLVAGGTIYYISQNFTLFAVGMDGNIQWSSPNIYGDRFSPLSRDAEGDISVLADTGGQLVLHVIGHDNSNYWQVILNGSAAGVLRAPVIDNSAILVLCNGQLFKVGTSEMAVQSVEPAAWIYAGSQAGNDGGVSVLVGWNKIRIFCQKKQAPVDPPCGNTSFTPPTIASPVGLSVSIE